MSDKFAWTVTIAALVLITYSKCHGGIDAETLRTTITVNDIPLESAPEPQEVSGVSGLSTTSCDEWRERLGAQNFQVHIVDAASARQGVLALREGPMVLVLVAKGPTTWSIQRGGGAEIRGVWLFSDFPQEIFGLQPHVPVLTSAWTRNSSCPRPQDPDPVLLVEQSVAEMLDVESIQSREGSHAGTAQIVDDVAGEEPAPHWQRAVDENLQESTANMTP